MAVHNSTQSAKITGVIIPDGARAVLVSLNDDGSYHTQPVEHGKSVLNLQRDLLLHLNEYPHSDEWITQLRDYCDGRLAARKEASANKRVMVPNWRAQWDMVGDTNTRPDRV